MYYCILLLYNIIVYLIFAFPNVTALCSPLIQEWEAVSVHHAQSNSKVSQPHSHCQNISSWAGPDYFIKQFYFFSLKKNKK